MDTNTTAPTSEATQVTICSGPVTGTWLNPLHILSTSCGAHASFLGVVRNEHHGKVVTAIDYDCYAEMARHLLQHWVAEARSRWSPQLRASIAHATGHSVPGDVAVAIHIATPHRQAALEACQWLIEMIKRDLPVWKHEHYADHTSAWLPGS